MREQPHGRPAGPRARLLAAIAIGGAAGALARNGLVEAFPPEPGHWPWVTFAVNIAGAIVLAWAVVRLARAPYRRALVGSGFCGALTTFSSLQIELLDMLDAGRIGLAAAYAAGSVAAGLVAVRVTTMLIRRA